MSGHAIGDRCTGEEEVHQEYACEKERDVLAKYY